MESIVEDSLVCLHQGLRLLRQLEPSVYTLASESTLNSSLGAHFRHNIDHFDCLIEGLAEGRVDYDHRERDEITETSPAAAIERMEYIAARLGELDGDAVDRAVQVKMDSGSAAEDSWSGSTVRRELQFLVSHTVHHYALIAVICRIHGIATEPEFGVAPSTLRHRAQMGEVSTSMASA